jgi:hypothetical protein
MFFESLPWLGIETYLKIIKYHNIFLSQYCEQKMSRVTWAFRRLKVRISTMQLELFFI